MNASANGAAPSPDGLPAQPDLADLARDMLAALPGVLGPAAAPAPDGAPAALDGAAPALGPLLPEASVPPGTTTLADIPHSLADTGVPVHEPPYQVPLPGPGVPAPPGWGLLVPPVTGAPGAAGLPLADPYAPLAAGPAFYFLASEPAAARTAGAWLAGEAGQAAGVPPSGAASTVPPSFDVEAVRRDFPILSQRVHGHRLVWLDNAATTQKPQAVINRLERYYRQENSNVHRGAHELAARATQAYEDARTATAAFLGAESAAGIVFVRGATEAINLVAQSWGRANVAAGDEIVVSCLEHHANIVPWQLLAAERGAVLRVIPVDDAGQILLDEYRRLLTDRTRLVAVTHVSNALGTVVPVREVVQAAHDAGALALVDGAQSVSHLPVDVRALDADFYLFSGHKIFGPTGIGALYGKPELLAAMPPWQGGGNMIREVTWERTSYQPPPDRFEAGTASIADAVALQTALEYVDRIGRANIAAYEHWLLGYATRALAAVPGLRLIGTAPDKASILSFVLAGYQPEEVASALNTEGIAVRAGHHCAQPILRRYGLTSTVRAALALYNTAAEVDQLAAALYGLAGRRAH